MLGLSVLRPVESLLPATPVKESPGVSTKVPVAHSDNGPDRVLTPRSHRGRTDHLIVEIP